MHSEAMSWVVSWTVMLALGLATALLLVGCEADPAGPTAAPTLATPSTINPAGAQTESELAAETRAIAERLSATIDSRGSGEAVALGPEPIDTSFDPFASAEPLDTRRPTPRASVALAVEGSTPAAASPEPSAPTAEREVAWLNADPDPAAAADLPATYQVAHARPGYPAPPVASESRPALTRAALLEELTQQVQASDDPALAKAVTAAALSLADPDRELDRRLLEPLKPMQRDAVERLHQLFVNLHETALDPETTSASATSGGGGFDHKAINAALADAFGEAPITIVHADLCRSVTGYGVYEPMGSHNFLSGRSNRAIVYVEVEDFAAATVEDERREVRLTQELILYKESDGLAVWRHEPTQIVDVSRNRRRDFYVVQMITLPQRLGEGRYRLKVRLTDQHGDSVDETTLKVQVVADVGLLAGDTAE